MRLTKNGVACIALSACMLFTSCQGVAPPSASPSKSSAVATAAAPSNLSVEVWDRGDYPSPSTAVNNPLTKWVIDKVKTELNINVTYVPVPRSEEVPKLNAMMAGNNAPDIVITYNPAVVASFAKNGGLTDLGPIIEQNGPNIKTSLKAQLPYGVVNGKQYSILAARLDDDLKDTTWIRKDILDKYNIPFPKTKAEFYAALTTVKKNEPNMVPYGMGETKLEHYYENFIMSFAKFANEKEFYSYPSELKMANPGSKEGFRELNKWYNEGLISKDFALDIDSKQYKSDITTGKTFAFSEDTLKPFDDNWVQTLAKTVPTANFMPINSFENEKGEYFFNKYDPTGMHIMVPKANEKNAVSAVKYISWMLAGDNLMTLKGGVGIGASSLDSSGIVNFKTADELSKMGIKDSMFNDIGIIMSKINYDNPEKFKKANIAKFSTPSFDATKAMDKMYEVRQAKGFFNYPIQIPVMDAESKSGANIRASIQSMASRVITAKPADFDALYEKEIQSMNIAGLKSILEQRAAAYDTAKK